MDNRDVNHHEKDLIGRKGGASTGATMHRDTVGQNVREGWHDFRAKVRAKWSQLTDKDLDAYQGRSRNDLVGFIGQRTGSERSVVERDVDAFARDTNYRWD